MAKFHGKAANSAWKFTTQEVIAFLRSKRDAKVPAWKRVKILEGLLVYRRMIQGQPIDEFLWIRDKLQEVVQLERAQGEGFDTIEEAVGCIDPNEPDVIQSFRRALRKDGKALRTERSYVGKLKAFMADRGLRCLSDFEGIGADDVEAHLTDLAVDGNVAPSTQNAAFHELLKFFTLVLKRDMGRVEAIRATKGKQIPTVMSTREVRGVLSHLNGVHEVIAKLL